MSKFISPAMIALLLILSACPQAALAMRSVDFAQFELPRSGAIALPVTETEMRSGVAAAVDKETGGNLVKALSEAGFTGKVGDVLTLFGVSPYTRIDIVGVGGEKIDRVAAEDFGGRLAALNDGSSGTPIKVLWHGLDRTADANAAHVALGFLLGAYRFDRYLEERADPATLGRVTILGDDPAAAGQFQNDLAHVATAVYLARDLSSEPANIIYPESFVDRVKGAFDGLDDVRIGVLDEKDLADRGMGAHLGVGSGSIRPPRLLIIEYRAGGAEPPLVLAGKGITFDSGGISIKDGEGMERVPPSSRQRCWPQHGAAPKPIWLPWLRWRRTCRAAPRSGPVMC